MKFFRVIKTKQLISIEELKKACEEYDYIHGIYPESEREGKAIFKFICERNKVRDKERAIKSYKY